MPAYKHNSPKKKKENWVSKLKKSIAALKGPGHSPAGKKYIAKQKRKTEPVYFKHIKRKSAKTRLREAGISDKELRALGYKK